tara:strand:- start:13 stop:492 length:480 start_codon:yes stop_codon:yes gene_type:complete
MKFITLAVLALINVQAVEYAESEGPTKADNSEADETVLPRTLDADGKWENPLSWSDVGADDDTVLTQLETAKHHHKKHHNKHHQIKRSAYAHEPTQYAQKKKAIDQYKGKKDAYDQDPTTTSPYDDMYQHKKFDWGVAEGAPGSKGPWGEYHGTWVDMR